MSDFDAKQDRRIAALRAARVNTRVACTVPACGFTTAPHKNEMTAYEEMADHLATEHGEDREAALRALIEGRVEGTNYAPVCPRCGENAPATADNWAASQADPNRLVCAGCSTDESIEMAATGRVTPASAWPVPGRHNPERHGFQSPDWRDQRSNRTHRPNPVPTPKELPDLRLHLLERWVDGGVFDRVAEAAPRTIAIGTASDGRWERSALRNASLWWIRDEMVELVGKAAPTIPEDVKASDIVLPDNQPFGLAVLGKPWEGTDAENPDQICYVDAVLWGPTTVAGVPCLTISSYRYMDFAGGLSPSELQLASATGLIHEAKSERIGYSPDTKGPAFRLYGGAWAWLGRTDWPLDAPLTDFTGLPRHSRDTDQRRLAMIEDRRWFASLSVLVNHRLSETEPVFAARQTRRRAERAGVKAGAAVNTVRIIRLRQAKHESHRDPDAPKGKANYSHRFMVGNNADQGFMAWRRCGPKGRDRKLVFIPAYIKGDPELPLVIKENVRVWVK